MRLHGRIVDEANAALVSIQFQEMEGNLIKAIGQMFNSSHAVALAAALNWQPLSNLYPVSTKF